MKNFTAYHLLKSFNKGTNNPNNIELHNIENKTWGAGHFLFFIIIFFTISTKCLSQNCTTLANCNFENGTMPSSPGIMVNSTGVSNSTQDAQPFSGSNFGICDFTFCNGMFGMSSCVMPGTTVTISGMTRSINLQSTILNHVVDADFEIYAAFLDVNGGTTLITGNTSIGNTAGQSWHLFSQSFSVPSNAYTVFIGFDAPHNPDDYSYFQHTLECADNPDGGDIGFDDLVISSSTFTPTFTATPQIQNICEGSAANLTATSSTGGIANWTAFKNGIYYGQYSGNFIQPILTAPGTYIFTTNYSCTLPCYTLAPPCTVVVYAHPLPPTISLQSGSSSPYCVNGTAPTIVINPQNNNNFQLTYAGSATPVTTSPFTVPPALGTTIYTAVSNLSPLVNNCLSSPVTISLTGIPAPVLSATNILVCNGSATPVTLYATPNNYSNYSWFSASGLNFTVNGNGSSITINGPFTVDEAFQVITNASNGCSNSAVANISIAHEPLLSISGVASTCSGSVLDYTLNSFNNSIQAFWSISPSTAGTFVNGISTGENVSIDWDNMAGSNATILVTYYYGPGCSTDISFEVEPCCAKGTEYTFYADGFSDDNTMTNDVYLSQIFANLTPNSNSISPGFYLAGGPGTGGPYNNIVFGGNIVVDMNLAITNNMIVDLLPNTSIFIMPGFSLTIDNGTVLKAACKEMWQGISALSGSNLTLNSGCIIQDADVGVITGSNSTLNFGASGAKVRFNKNHIALAIVNHTSPSNVIIKNTVFECRAGAYASDELLLSPYVGEMSAIGIFLLKNLQTLTIGQISANQNNNFDNLVYGIMSTESNFRLFNNSFEHISYDDQVQYTSYDCDCKCPTGTAVCANGRTGNYNVTIGGNSLTYPAVINTVTDSDNGFYIYNNINAYIESNSMLNIKNIGMLLSQNYIVNGSYTVKRNNLKDIQFNHLLLIDNPKTYKTIENNDINVSYNPNYKFSTAIQIIESAKAPLPVIVVDNHIYEVQTGIYTSKVNYLNANNNYIDLNANPDMSQGFGIVVWEGQNHSITNNQIRAANRNNYYVDGIRLEYTPKTTVSCNSMERTGSGVFLNGTCTDSKIFQNNLRRNFWGYIINNAVSGLQQPNMYSDNIWTGPYDNNTLDGGAYWHTFNMGSDPYQNAMNVRNQTLPGNVHKPVPFYAKNDAGNNTFNLWPDPSNNPLGGPIYYPNLYGNNNQPDYGPCQNVIATDTLEGDAQMMQQILSNTIQSPKYNQENIWWLKYQLFVSAKADTSMAQLNGMQAFIDSVEQVPMGQLEQITALISDSTAKDSLVLTQIKNQNNLIVASNNIETLLKWINDKAIDLAISETDTLFNGYGLSMIEENDIEALAQDCPFEKGPAVFVARALIKKLKPQSPIYINYCERVQPAQDNRSASSFPFEYENDTTELHDMDYLLELDNNRFVYELKLYPNPSNSVVTLESKELITKIELSNSLGQIILIDNSNAASRKSFNLKDLPKGLYLIKVYNYDIFAIKQLSLID